MAGGRADSVPPVRRGSAAALTAALHLAALFLFLRPAAPIPTAGEQPLLRVFDLAPPPPEVVVPPPRAPDPGGGSPGRARERPAERAVLPDRAKATVDTTPAAVPPPVPAPAPATGGVAPAGLVGEGAAGVGLGTGSGAGVGAGTGTGIAVPAAEPPTRATWVTVPTTRQFAQEWPPRGKTREGHVVLICEIRRSLLLRRCSVYSENPARLGFGAAALRLVAFARARPGKRDGKTLWDQPTAVGFDFRLPATPRLPPAS